MASVKLIALEIIIILLFRIIEIRSEEIFNVLDFGAKTDGLTINTEAINKAIVKASDRAGGGTVHFPAGHYLTGPIHFVDNIALQIDFGAVIKFSDNFDDYLPMVESRDGGINLLNFSPLIYAYDVDNITLKGEGTLDGSREKWWTFNKNLTDDYRKTGVWNKSSKWQQEFFRVNNISNLGVDNPNSMSGFFRPNFIQFIEARNVLISGLTIINSPAWNINPVYCDNVTITGVNIENPPNSPNTDGIDPDSSTNVFITNSTISVGDDCLVIKSGRDVQGRTIARPSENIVVSNCTMLRGHGGIVIGSEMSGGVNNVTVTNCLFNGTDNGIRMKSTRGRGGVVDNITIKDIRMENIVRTGITINMFYTKTDYEPFSNRTPVFRNIFIENIRGNAKQAIELIGLPESPLENVNLVDISINSSIGVTSADIKNINFKNVITTS